MNWAMNNSTAVTVSTPIENVLRSMISLDLVWGE
jgi:hypothetical protein